MADDKIEGSTEEIQKLMTTRAKYKGWVTRISKQALSVIHEKVEQPRSAIQAIHGSLSEKFGKFKDISEQLLFLMTEEEFSNDNEIHAHFEFEMSELVARLDNMLNVTDIDAASVVSRVSSVNSMRVKLPKLNVKSFAGGIIEWAEFWDLYSVAVHENDDVPPVQKFVYLKSLVTSEAARCIAAMETTAENYQIAIDRLLNRYGKKEVRQKKLMGNLVYLKPMSENTAAVREAVDEITATVRGLEALGIGQEQFGTVILPVIESKLPKSWHARWSRTILNNSDIKFEDLLVFMEQEVAILEAVDRSNLEKTGQNPGISVSKPRPPMTASALVTQSTSSKPPPKCTFCEGSHKPVACEADLTVDERYDLLRAKRGCFRCGFIGHHVATCRYRRKCADCNRMHIKQLCPGKIREKSSHSVNSPPNSSAGFTSQRSSNNAGTMQSTAKFSLPSSAAKCASDVDFKAVRMRTVAVTVGDVLIRGLCDTGCTYTTVSPKLLQKVPSVYVGHKCLTLSVYGDVVEGRFPVARLTVRGLNFPSEFTFEAVVSDGVTGTFERVPGELYSSLFEYAGNDAVLADVVGDGSDEIGIMFGEDVYDQIVVGRTVNLKTGMKATPTIFGWMLHGFTGQVAPSVCPGVVGKIAVQSQVKKFWELEHLGVLPAELEENDVELSVCENITKSDGHYVVQWPWKPNCAKYVSENKYVSLGRLNGLLRKQSPETYEQYNREIESLVDEGHVELLPEGETPLSFLPHRGVYRENAETTKLRVVFDASAKSGDGLSLNEALEKGPNLLPLLWGVLLRFRVGEVALTGDIAKAFLQIVLKEEDRNYCCFIWQTPDGERKIYRIKKVIFGATSSPFLLQCVLKYHLKLFDCESAQILQNCLYVDDFVCSTDSEKCAELLWNDAVNILSQGGFELRKFQTNCEHLKNAIVDSKCEHLKNAIVDSKCENLKNAIVDSKCELLKNATVDSNCENVKEADLLEQPENSVVQNSVKSVLGVNWDLNSDCLLPFVTKSELTLEIPTKRSVLASVSKIYDPLGLVCPIVTPLKILLQDLWNCKLGWDDIIPTEMQDKVTIMFQGMQNASEIVVPRWLKSRTFNSQQPNMQHISLHVFCDASQRAYAAAAYLRVSENGNVDTSLITAKCRLGPPAGETIPRLELLGALIGSRLLVAVKNELCKNIDISEYYLWTDSKVALSWIERGPGSSNVFVSNRVQEIRENGGKWLWVPTDSNPADLPTRGTTVSQLRSSKLWWQGPSWLSTSRENWPKTDNKSVPSSLTASVKVSKTSKFLESVVETKRVSRWLVLVRVIACIKRWKCLVSRKTVDPPQCEFVNVGRHSEPKPRLLFESVELKNASSTIFQQVQEKFFSEERAALEEGKPVSKRSPIWAFHPFCCNGLIRMGGRFQMAGATYEEKHPVLLKMCAAVKLLIMNAHEVNFHAGVAVVLAYLRANGVWILRPKRSISNVLRNCRKCTRFLAAPGAEKVGQYPESRLQLTRAFATTGMDMGGPLYLSDGGKVWFLLCTCMATRAVHLELCVGLSQEALASSLQRFFSRRGVPSKCISDHGTNFVALSKWLKNSGYHIEWEFIVERAPWWGGAWERLVQTVKGLLKRSIGKSSLTFDELSTALTCVESVVNSRPITFTWEGAHAGNVPAPIVPMQFLLPPNEDSLKNPYDFQQEILQRKEWFSELKKVWRTEYLHAVLGEQREIWKSPPNPVTVGDVVLIEEDNITRKNRLLWQMGLVVKLHKGRDGLCRAATVKVLNGVLRRPIQKLYKLEIAASSNNSECPTSETDECVDDEPVDNLLPVDDSNVGVNVTNVTRTGREVRRPRRFDE